METKKFSYGNVSEMLSDNEMKNITGGCATCGWGFYVQGFDNRWFGHCGMPQADLPSGVEHWC